METASQIQHEAAEAAEASITHTTQRTQSEEVVNSNTVKVAAPAAGLKNLACRADNLPPPYCVRYDKIGFPATLLDWRREPKDDHHTARHLWKPLEKRFRLHGYELFVSRPPDKLPGLRPKDPNEIRALDQFHAIIPDGSKVLGWTATHTSNKCCPATRIRDGTHVMIELVCKARQGVSELEVLRRFSRPDIAAHPDNHVIPLLDELSYLDMVFAVSPLLENDLVEPWFYTLAEALDAVGQTFKALAFMHSHYVAHRDIGFRDILLNFGGLRGRHEWSGALRGPVAFRSRLSAQCRYTFIDFEVAKIFPYGTDPATHRSSGVHFIKNGRIPDANHYAKPMPPEWTQAGSYCVYKSDVYQIGRLWQKYLAPLQEVLPGLHNILDRMTQDNPAHRPTMAEASAGLQSFVQDISEDTLQLSMWQYRP